MGRRIIVVALALGALGCREPMAMNATVDFTSPMRQVTTAAHGHVLTNIGVWSPDGRWIVYDVRSDEAGSVFDGDRIERVNVETGEVQELYRATAGAKCGVVTHHPRENKVVLILGPENPTPDWQYAANKRRGLIVDNQPKISGNSRAAGLDARDLASPYTPGALRGGTHVHTFCPQDQRFVSFTYNDFVLSRFTEETADHETDLRNVGVTVLGHGVSVPKAHPRNHDGAGFSVLLTRTTANPAPGSDEIKKAYEDAWVAPRSLAFLGDVVTREGKTITELFMVEVPDWPRIAQASDGPLEGTEARRPRPPRGVEQRRLTFTGDRKHGGLSGPRFWPRSSPDGTRIAFLMKDDAGIVQLFTISPNGGAIRQVTNNPWPIASAFSWSADGRWIAHAMDNSVFVTEWQSGRSIRLTERAPDATAPRPEACVFSPDGQKIAFVRTIQSGPRAWNQVFVVPMPVE